MEKHIEINNVDIHYNDIGSGRTVVLMHGWGCSSATLLSIQNLLQNDFRIINIDLPGFGNSSEPQSVWGVYEYADVIEKLLAHENIVDPIMLGHSYGGRIAIIYASRNNVAKLILVDAAGIKPRRSLKYYFKVYSYKFMKHVLPLVLGQQRGQRLLDRYRSRVGSSDYRQASQRMRAIMSKSIAQDLKHLMPLIKAPTLLIWGENDTATPLSDAKTMNRLIPDSGLVAFPGCGHYSFLDNPSGFAAVINSFLNNDKKSNK